MINNPPLFDGEDTFIHSIDDFITARRKSENNLRHGSRIADALESRIAKHPNSWLHVCGVSASHTPALFLVDLADTHTQGFIKGENERRRTRDPLIHHFSSSNLAILERIVASILAIGTMLIPVLVLFLCDLSREKMAAIAVCFVLLFMGTISVFVEVTPHDLFIGVAAYVHRVREIV